MNNDITNILKPEPNPVANVRKVNAELGSLVNDICDYVQREDYKRAASAAAYLLIALARKAGSKPFSLLRTANR